MEVYLVYDEDNGLMDVYNSLLAVKQALILPNEDWETVQEFSEAEFQDCLNESGIYFIKEQVKSFNFYDKSTSIKNDVRTFNKYLNP